MPAGLRGLPTLEGECRMNCPKCGSERIRVVDTKSDRESTIRTRVCKSCGYRYKTIEYELDLYQRTEGKNDQD